MRLLERIEREMASSGGALREDSDFWFAPTEGIGSSIGVTPETAMRQSAVLACVSLKSGILSTMPLIMYKRLPNGGRRRAPEHPLYDVLHEAPNSWMTAAEFKRLIGICIYLRGNFFAIIVPGRRGFVDQLIPVHPASVSVRQLPNRALIYRVTDPATHVTQEYSQDQIFHLRDISIDGIIGLSRIAQQRDAISMALGLQGHGAAIFRNSARPGGVLSTDKILPAGKRDENLAAWNAAYGGSTNAGKTALLDGGAKFQAIGMTQEDAQYIETMRYSACDIARIFGVPPHLIGETDRSTSWGPGIEQQTMGFMQFSMMPEIVLVEEGIGRDLIIDTRNYFAEFLVDSILRADFKTRIEGYGTAIEHGIVSPDEARKLENLNPRDDGRGGIYWRPANMIPDDGTVVPAAPPMRRSSDQNPAPPQGANGKNGAIHATEITS